MRAEGLIVSDPAVLDILEPSSPATEPYTQSADNVQPASCRRWSVTGRAKTGGRKPWYRYVPLNPDLTVQTVGPDGEPCIIDDTLACLAHAEPDTDATPPVLTAEMYTAAFQAWAVARQHLYDRWMWQTDPANLAPQIPRAMRDAAALVMAKGEHLGDAQDALGSRLNRPTRYESSARYGTSPSVRS